MKTTSSIALAIIAGCLGYGISTVGKPAEVPTDSHRLNTAAISDEKPANAPPDTVSEPVEPTLKKLKELAQSSPAEALRWIAQMHEQMQLIASTASRQLTPTQPALAAELAAALRKNDKDVDVLAQTGTDWAKLDPNAAIAWGQNYNGPGKTGFLLHSWHELLQSDLKLDISRTQEAANALKSMLSEPTEDADRRLAQGEMREALLARTWALGARAEAIRMLEHIGTVSETYRHCAWKTLGAWLNEDGIAASEWVRQLPPGEQRDKYIFRVIKYANTTDHAAVPNWIDALTTPYHRFLAAEALKTGRWPRFD